MGVCEFLRGMERHSVEDLVYRSGGLKVGHKDRVNDLVRAFANTNGFSSVGVRLSLLNTYQDIGEVIFSHLISQPRRLSRDERRLVNRHPIISAHILETQGFEEVMGEDLFYEILYHHERYDGKGFFGIKRKDIPFYARILGPMDFYVAITSDRPHRKAVSHEMALEEIEAQSGRMFDPEMVPTIVETIENSPAYPMGCAQVKQL